jgi:hypothetical protein
MDFVYNDGGRSRYFKAKSVGDCVTRAIAIATRTDYKEVYDSINKLAKAERVGSKKRHISSSRNGVYKITERKYLESKGWSYKPLMKIGASEHYYLTESDLETLGLEDGRYILQIRRHLTAVVDGVINDTFNPSEYYDPMLYGYYYKA